MINAKGKVENSIYEYSKYETIGFDSDDVYYFTIWDDLDNVLVKSSSYLGNRFYIKESKNVTNAISTHKNIKVRLSGRKYTTLTYNFTVNTEGFVSTYKTIKELWVSPLSKMKNNYGKIRRH